MRIFNFQFRALPGRILPPQCEGQFTVGTPGTADYPPFGARYFGLSFFLR
jgi:hypothetical protein